MTAVAKDPNVYEHEVKINGRNVRHGQEITVEGIRGRSVFLRRVTTPSGRTWIDILTSRDFMRSVHEDKITRVHRRVQNR
jgi:hypothetical protein